jgi:hypothetical protein
MIYLKLGVNTKNDFVFSQNTNRAINAREISLAKKKRESR